MCRISRISRISRIAKLLVPAGLALGWLLVQAGPALACGGLVAPNGAVRLGRATTLVAWHNGVEHYLTSFTYTDPCTTSATDGAPAAQPLAGQQAAQTAVGCNADVGWIVPLPAVPTSVQEGGAWTLQRLERETHPQPSVFFDGGAAVAASAQVLQQVQVEALDITVLKGSGQEVIDWCRQNGFALDGDTRAHLLRYAQASPIFMAAKYNAARAAARGQLQGDGTPVLITMPTAHIWVPFEVLALDGQQVQADLYLLTDMPLNTSAVGAVVGQSAVGTQVPGAPGMTLAFQERMTPTLYHDLSTDRNGSWVPRNAWLTYLQLDAPQSEVTYDLGVSTTGVIRVAPFGTQPDLVAADPSVRQLPSWLPRLPLGTPEVALTVALTVALLLASIGGLGWLVWRANRTVAQRV